VFLDVLATANQFEGRCRFYLAVVDCPFKALTRCASAATRTSTRTTCWNPPRDDSIRGSLVDRATTRRSCAPASQSCRGAREIINLVYYHERAWEEAGEIIGFQST